MFRMAKPADLILAEDGVAAVVEWLAPLMDAVRVVTEDDEQDYGDLHVITRGGRDLYLEVKSQRRQDPHEFPDSVHEVCKLHGSGWHVNGLDSTAALLGMSTEEFSSCQYRDYRRLSRPFVTLGHQDRVEVSLGSTAYSEYTIHVNPIKGWMYVFDRVELLHGIADAVREGRWSRGQGCVDRDTLTAFVPVRAGQMWRWDQRWHYLGSAAEHGALMAGLEIFQPVC